MEDKQQQKAETNWTPVIHPETWEDLRYWSETDKDTVMRALRLIEATLEDPFTGIGKPEPLNHLAPDMWSRRLSEEHRLVYLVGDGHVHFLQARYHY